MPHRDALMRLGRGFGLVAVVLWPTLTVGNAMQKVITQSSERVGSSGIRGVSSFEANDDIL